MAKAASPSSKGLPSGCRLTHVTSLQGLQQLGPAWRALEESSAVRPTVFQSFDWVSQWCEVFACPESRVEISVVAGYHGNDLVFIAPWQKVYRRGINRLVWLTYPMAQYGDVLCSTDENVGAWMEAAFALLKQSGRYDVLHLRHVRQNSVIFPFAAKHMKDGKLYEKAPFMDYTSFPNIQAYDNRLSRTQKKHRKKVRAHLSALGEVTFEHIGAGEKVSEVIDHALAQKRIWLKRHGLMSAVISDLRHDALMKTLAQRQGGSIAVDVTQLSVNGMPLSWEVSLRYGRKHYCYIISRSNQSNDQSPGRLHFDLNQRRTFQQGFTCYDLLLPNHPHKESWSNALEPVNDYYYPLTRWGRIYGDLYIKRLRPVLRGLYNRGPLSLKRMVIR